METQATTKNIDKYFKVLKDLKMILDNTPYLSMFNFSIEQKVTKNLSTILQKLGIVSMVKRGRYSQWKWLEEEPTVEMAIIVLKELAALNPPRLKREKDEDKVTTLITSPKREYKKRKPLNYYECKLLFGLIKIKIKAVYKD